MTTNRLLTLLGSMRFAVSILSVLGIASIIGTVLKQNEPYGDYLIKFGPFWFSWFDQLGLYDVYHSFWFLGILLFLLVSLSFCLYQNTPRFWRRWQGEQTPMDEAMLRRLPYQASFDLSNASHSPESLQIALRTLGFRYRFQPATKEGVLLTAQKHGYKRLGYIMTHAAIVMICVGGVLDGNLYLKLQDWLGYKVIETRDIPQTQVPAKSRLSADNPAFRANMLLVEGGRESVGFVRLRDGYLVQELPFAVRLKRFYISHYASGPPKSFTSELEIEDPMLAQPLAVTLSVNHPYTYKGVTLYQSDFSDGGSALQFRAWRLFSDDKTPITLNAHVFGHDALPDLPQKFTAEYEDFRLFNILNLSADGKGKPRNVGPSVRYKLRDSSGQAHEYINYMQAIPLEGSFYFVSGMRATPRDDWSYWRIPMDAQGGIEDFMRFRALLMSEQGRQAVAKRVALSLHDTPAQQIQTSVLAILNQFVQGGFNTVAQSIIQKVPAAKQQQVATIYLKLLNLATQEAYGLLLPKVEIKPHFLQDSLVALNDMFFYGAPYYLELKGFEHKQASGLQLTKSPGKPWVYIGSVLLLLGILAMLYGREQKMWLLIKPQQWLLGMDLPRIPPQVAQEMFAGYRQTIQSAVEQKTIF